MDNLSQLAGLIRKRNLVEREITALISRPMAIGYVGEYIAASIFQIALEESASHKSIDGRFSYPPLEGRTVNIKWYAFLEGILDITPEALPDYYLVLTGPKSPAMSSRGRARPWTIDAVYLFEAPALVDELKRNGIQMGVATSVRKHLWENAEIFPSQRNKVLPVSEKQRGEIMLFSGGVVG